MILSIAGSKNHDIVCYCKDIIKCLFSEHSIAWVGELIIRNSVWRLVFRRKNVRSTFQTRLQRTFSMLEKGLGLVREEFIRYSNVYAAVDT